MSEMEEEVWSQSEATPVVQHFPTGKGSLPTGEWQPMHPGRIVPNPGLQYVDYH